MSAFVLILAISYSTVKSVLGRRERKGVANTQSKLRSQLRYSLLQHENLYCDQIDGKQAKHQQNEWSVAAILRFPGSVLQADL